MMLIALTILVSSSSVQHGLLGFLSLLTHQTPSPPSVSAIERGFLGNRPMNHWVHNTRWRLWRRCSALWGFPRCLVAIFLEYLSSALSTWSTRSFLDLAFAMPCQRIHCFMTSTSRFPFPSRLSSVASSSFRRKLCARIALLCFSGSIRTGR